MVRTKAAAVTSPPPDLRPLVDAQVSAARFYVQLTVVCVCAGLAFVAIPTLITVADAESHIALRIGGSLLAALGAFPSAKYLQRRDRVFALRMIELEYVRLRDSGLLTSPERVKLDGMVTGFVRGMIR